MNIFPLVCPHCFTVAVFDTPTNIGEPRMCPCLDRPPFTSPVAFMVLRLPEGFEVARKVEIAA